MKRKSLLFLLLMAMFAPLAMNAQSRSTLTVYGDNTTTNEYVPIYGFYCDEMSKCEFIIPKEKLSAMNGGIVSDMKFYLSSSNSSNDISATFNVFVKEVNTTTLTGFTGTTNATSVYTSTISIPKSQSNIVLDIPFSSNYIYGGGNLLIGVYQTGNSSYNHTYWTGESQSGNTAWQGYGSGSGSGRSFLPKTTFTYEVSSTPYITLTPASATVITGSTETLTANYGNVSGTPTITYSSNNTSVATVIGSGTTATVTAVAPGTATITATMNGSYTATCTITVENPSYCTPSYSQTSDYIKSFVTTGGTTNISNTNTGQGTGGYSDFYNSHSASIDAGETLSFTVTRGYSDSYKYAIWVDWNHDYVFDVTTETVAQQTTSVNNDWSSSFTIPANTAAGDYRMRVEMLYGSSATLNPCVSASYGEVEDYKLTVLAASNCPTPTITNIAVTDHEAVISTDSDAENFNVQYRVVSEPATSTTYDFEDGTSQGWTTYDNDGDGYSWGVSNQLGSSSGGQTYVDSHGGDYYIVSSYNDEAYAENWLISPQFKLGGSISFYVKRLRNSNYDDYYRVYVSTTGTNISDFSEITTSAIEPGFEYELKTFDLSSYSGQGYVAIKHFANAYDQAYIFLDDITIVEGEDQNPWQTTNDLTLTGLSSGTTYEVQVQANCGATDGLSGWSSSATFTTIDNCAVPTGLTAEVTGNAAELSWAGYADTYDIHYREVDPTAPATIILTTTDIWNDGSGYQMLLDADATAFDNIETNGISDYSIFEYLIPTNATYDPNTSGFVLNTSVSIQIPAGTYDWFITNPSPDYNNVYIAASNGNVGGRQDNYVFEAGKTYEFVPSLYGQNDGVDVTITAAWTLVEGVTNPYLLENLSSQTTYEFQVQGADCDNWSANATFTTPVFSEFHKTIKGYSGQNGGYELIASPIGNVAPTSVTNMLSNSYDLYYFNQSGYQGDNYVEWINYKPEPGTYEATDANFNLVRGKGYLYANSQTVDLVFTGVAPSTEAFSVTLAYDGDARFAGWNLVGNPYAEPAYFTPDRDFYTMNSAGTSFVVCQDPDRSIEAMQGVFVIAESNNETLTFTTQPTSKGRGIVLKLSEGRSTTDAAIVRFGEGRTLPKLQLFEGSTKIYIPQEGKEYAVVRSEEMGEMPVNFKAENNGTFSLNVSGQNTEFAYLHLIDNLTGNDVDLLETPSYSFEAKTTDYASRFKLVYATGNASDDTFAFYSNGSFVINNDGKATLQVIDIMGRILKSENINGCANLNVNAAPGVYMLRLVNGDNVKVQKVIVK